MTLDDWLEKIENLHPIKWDLGLDRVGEVGDRLGVLKPAPVVFLVAGTNGKGSTCEYLEKLCLIQGIRVGKTVSPHFNYFNERIVVDGQAVLSSEICEAFESIEKARGEISLSYFEFAALAALLIFKHHEVEVAVLEVGLGGRLDAMNIIEPDVSIITQIALDHESWLGDTLDLIAREKAGIMRKGKPCLIAGDSQPPSLKECAKEKGVKLLSNGEEFGIENSHAWYQHTTGDVVEMEDLPEGMLPAPSAIAALQAFVYAGFDISEVQFRQMLEETSLPGRMQWIGERILLDVAHNPNAAEYLKCRLEALPEEKVIHAVVGMYADKDCKTVLSILGGLIEHWYLTDMEDTRAASAKELENCLSDRVGCVINTYDKISSAYGSALKAANDNDLVLIFGSFPVVGSVLKLAELEPEPN
jgi:dihydrofolate synthase / folylpolyglutamate synthase